MTSITVMHSYKNTKKGYPLLLHSFKPYSAFNFQARALFTLKGKYTWVGILGLSKDGENYVVARYNGQVVQFCKVRNGNLTVLASAEFPLISDTVTQIDVYVTLFHKNGNFNVYVNLDGVVMEPILSYRWKESDGAMCVDNDLFHVGVYSFIDPPHFRITSFDIENCDGIPYLPGTDLSGFSLFPSSGQVQIDDCKYVYAARVPNELTHYRGPYQVRNIGNDAYANSSSGLSFSGKYLEASMFEWSNNKDDMDGYLIATDAQYAWLISDIDRKIYTQYGKWPKRSARFFCPSKGVVSTTHRAWVTCGLLQVSLSVGTVDTAAHNMGSVCFLDSDDEATLHLFDASSGDRDATIGDLLKSVSQMSGIQPALSGDIVHSSLTLSSSGTSV